jgi:hypothetical protein
MDEAVILHVNLIPPAVGKRAAGGCELLLCGRVLLGVNPLRPIRIYQIGAHVSIAGIHDESFFHGVRIETTPALPLALKAVGKRNATKARSIFIAGGDQPVMSLLLGP